MKTLTTKELEASVDTPFYADLELIEVKKDAPGIRTNKIDGALFPKFPKVGERVFCYTNDVYRYLHTSPVESILVNDDFIRIQTRNSVYVLKNFLTNS